MKSTYEILRPITVMRDDLIAEQLPASVLKQLGDLEETGFHLGFGRRDLFYTNGCVRYVLGSKSTVVELDCR